MLSTRDSFSGRGEIPIPIVCDFDLLGKKIKGKVLNTPAFFKTPIKKEKTCF